MTEAALLLADTMVVAWYVLDPARIPASTKDLLNEETTQGRPISVSAYSLVELAYMREKKNAGGISKADYEAVRDVLMDPDGPFVVVPVDAAIALLLPNVPRKFEDANGGAVVNADPGDRIIAATAIGLKLTVVTSDHKIHSLSGALGTFSFEWAAA